MLLLLVGGKAEGSAPLPASSSEQRGRAEDTRHVQVLLFTTSFTLRSAPWGEAGPDSV